MPRMTSFDKPAFSLALAFAAIVAGAPMAAGAQTADPAMPMDHTMPVDHTMPMGHSAHDMAGMDAMHGMKGMLGPYSMMRDASGTAWQPDSAPMQAIMGHTGDWSTMIHGMVTLIYDKQGGPRGAHKTFSTSMLMGMAQRPLGGGTLTLRGMGSLDPLMGRSGYPLLLATGETADGRTPLIDRQHPHDALMELSATYSHPLTDGLSGFVYAGMPGEPALGPVTFMHRFSGIANPEAPIAHHWLDSTHVTFGVVTAGLTARRVKLEGSVFTGREPDQKRWNFDKPRFDSWSARVTFNPTDNLSLQVSHGYLKSPEQLTPDDNEHRTTASATWNRALGPGRTWQTTFAWGRNRHSGGDHHAAPARAQDEAPSDAFLLESALQWRRWTAFGRAENVDKDELFLEPDPLAGQRFNVSKLTLGGYHSVPLGPIAFDLGGLVSGYALPRAAEARYGGHPTSFMLFSRLRIVGR